MADVPRDQSFDEDVIATFDNSAGNLTAHASSEVTNAATAVDGDDKALEEEDDDAAEMEEDDEEDEEEAVEDEAGV
jgi:hypothetical protein